MIAIFRGSKQVSAPYMDADYDDVVATLAAGEKVRPTTTQNVWLWWDNGSGYYEPAYSGAIVVDGNYQAGFKSNPGATYGRPRVMTQSMWHDPNRWPEYVLATEE